MDRIFNLQHKYYELRNNTKNENHSFNVKTAKNESNCAKLNQTRMQINSICSKYKSNNMHAHKLNLQIYQLRFTDINKISK